MSKRENARPETVRECAVSESINYFKRAFSKLQRAREKERENDVLVSSLLVLFLVWRNSFCCVVFGIFNDCREKCNKLCTTINEILNEREKENKSEDSNVLCFLLIIF